MSDAFAYEVCCQGIPHCEHWQAFDRLMVAAHVRGELLRVAWGLITELSAYEKPITPQSLFETLLMRWHNTKPHDALDDAVLEILMHEVARQVSQEWGARHE